MKIYFIQCIENLYIESALSSFIVFVKFLQSLFLAGTERKILAL